MVAGDTGIPSASVENWLKGLAFPRAVHQFRLMAVYGPSALAAMMPKAPRWLDEAVRADETARLVEDRRRIDERLAQITGGHR